MDKILLYPIGTGESCRYAAIFLQKNRCPLIDHPSPEITHILLDTPSFRQDGLLQDGSDLTKLLPMLPKNITVIGGNLDSPSLKNYKKLDLLKDPGYLAENAGITAACALQVAAGYLKSTFHQLPVLIFGWGRIGKHLARLCKALGAHVTVAARKASDRAMLSSMGYTTIAFSQIPKTLQSCKVLFNTVPDLPVEKEIIEGFTQGIAIDLASHPGMLGSNVICARGLPGKYAPESSGKLIAKTICRRL